MPKTSDEYLDQKKTLILNAAQKIVSEKPLNHVTMRDLIRHCNVSQGAIYHYFSGLDEIWFALIERLYKQDDINAQIAAILPQAASPAEALSNAAALICSHLKKIIPTYGKLILELNTALLANTDLYQKAIDSQKGFAKLDQLAEIFMGYCINQFQAGTLKPLLPLENIGYYIASSYLGLRYQATVLHLTSDIQNVGVALTDYINIQVTTWLKTVSLLLGVPEDELKHDEKTS